MQVIKAGEVEASTGQQGARSLNDIITNQIKRFTNNSKNHRLRKPKATHQIV